MRILFTLVWALGIVPLFAQVSINMQARIDTVEIDKYKLVHHDDATGLSQMLLEMPIGDYKIINERIAKQLQKETITKVELVYTDYPKGLDMRELNRARILELYIHLPQVFNKRVIEWKVVKQTGAKNNDMASHMIHGFVITYRPLPSFEAENNLISSVLEGKTNPDSTILKVLERHPNWKDQIVVCDVTGSMSPYLASLVLWLKLNNSNKLSENFVFFNDNDMDHNKQEKLDTSGIWDVSSKKYDAVLKKMLYAMYNGGQTENNLKATFYASQKFMKEKKKEGIIMIADNWQDPYDMKLLPALKEIGVPIHVIVCGVSATLNPNYLDIALATNGSVHTIEADLEELAKISEGKTVKFGTFKLKMTNGKLVPMK